MSRPRRAPQKRAGKRIIPSAWQGGILRILATSCVLGLVLYIIFAEKIPLIGASCNVPEKTNASIVKKTNAGADLTEEDSTRAIVAFRNSIQSLIDASGISKNSKVSIRIVSAQQNEVFFEKNPHQYLTPASTTKLFPTFAAYHTLGANYMVPTQVLTNAPIEDGIVKGDIYIKGFGDALLTEVDIKSLVKQLQEKGIKGIEGNVYADATYFDNITERHIYSGDNEIVEPLAPITALGMNRNGFAVEVNSGGIAVIPHSDAIAIHGNATSIESSSIPAKKTSVKSAVVKKKKGVEISKKKSSKKSAKGKAKTQKTKSKSVIKSKKKAEKKSSKKKKHATVLDPSILSDIHNIGDVPPAPPEYRKKPRKQRVSISTSTTQAGYQLVHVRGRGSATAYFSSKYPDIFVAGNLRYNLRNAGITVSGNTSRKAAPQGSEVIAEFKRPLSYIVGMVNKNSDNFLAEHVYKLLGAHAGGHSNTGKAATEEVKRVLIEHGIPADGVCIYDGSGLCRKNLFSAEVQTMLLLKALKLSFGQDYKSSLSIAGVDGTLKRRMVGTYAQSNVRAKTGTLKNTSALSGYVYTRDGEQIVFSIISNGPSVGEYKQLENRIAEAIANFSYATSVKGGTH